MKYKIYLDDERTPNDKDWIVVRNYGSFIKKINEIGLDNIDVISFDHDLGEEHINYYFDNGGRENPPDPLKAHFTEKTGYDCAKWLVEYCTENGLPMPTYLIHSANPVGADNIRAILQRYTELHPFS